MDLRERLKAHVAYFLDNPAASSIDYSTFLSPYINDVPAQNGLIIKPNEPRLTDPANRRYIRIDFHNASERMIEPKLLRYDLIFERNIFLELADRPLKCTSDDIPNDKRILNIPLSSQFLPNQWCCVRVMVFFREDQNPCPGETVRYPVKLRGTSETTCRDIDFELEIKQPEWDF